jgi:hypothetical protein
MLRVRFFFVIRHQVHPGSWHVGSLRTSHEPAGRPAWQPLFVTLSGPRGRAVWRDFDRWADVSCCTVRSVGSKSRVWQSNAPPITFFRTAPSNFCNNVVHFAICYAFPFVFIHLFILFQTCKCNNYYITCIQYN